MMTEKPLPNEEIDAAYDLADEEFILVGIRGRKMRRLPMMTDALRAVGEAGVKAHVLRFGACWCSTARFALQEV